MQYKIGQILTSKIDTEVEKSLSGQKVTIPSGNKIIIGADCLAHHIKNDMIQPLGNNAEVNGYDTNGLAEYLYISMKSRFPFKEMMEDFDITEKEIKDEIEFALEEIGF